MSNITSKTILITGASSGFGRDMAEILTRAGHTVFASMRDVAGKHRDQANALRKQGIAVVELDVSNDASVDAAVKEVLARANRVDVLVNNAGIASAGVTEAFTADQAKVIFNTNVVGLLRSKFAVEALTDSLRYEVSQLGIEVVLIQPSAYPTNMYAAIQQPADAARAAAYGAIGEIPAKLFETFKGMFASANAPNPHDVARAIAKLIATPKGARAARLVVGQAFGADAVNDAVAPIQHRVLEGLGLSALTILAKQAA